MVPWPPFWVARIVQLAQNSIQKCGMPPLCNLGRKFQHTKGQNLSKDLFFFWSSRKFGPKTGIILVKTFLFSFFFFFFFWSSPNFVQKNGLILSGEIFLLVFIIFEFPAPLPFFEHPAYATAYRSTTT